MKKTLFLNARIFTPKGFIQNGHLLVEGTKIISIAEKEIFEKDVTTIDANNLLLLPGFIDIHCNGGGGGMAIDGKNETINNIISTHSKFGTTGMLLTTISVEDNVLENSLKIIAKNKSASGSEILGIHLEGPFLSIEKRGAHQKQYLKLPDTALLKKYINISDNKIKILSLAPELPNALETLAYAKKQGIIVGFAHSEANYEQTITAINNGMTFCTHLFNAMNPFSHKDVGPIGAFLTSRNTFVEFITDGIHVHPKALEIAMTSKGFKKSIICTDAVAPAGTNLKEFEILGIKLEVRGNTCYVPGGGLAGSALTMNNAVKTVSSIQKIGLINAIMMASEVPARLLKINNKKGRLKVGYDADLLLADDNLSIKLTMVNGAIVHNTL